MKIRPTWTIAHRGIIVGLALLVMVAGLFSACIGAMTISLPELGSILLHNLGFTAKKAYGEQQEAVLLVLRLPRVTLAILIGAGLGISGAAIQGLFRNPLAEPGLIGISSGASLFAVLMIVLETRFFSAITGLFGYYALSFAAFAGACLTAFIVYGLGMKNGKTNITTLLLGGIAINALAGALTGLLTYMATDDQLRNITFWSLGSLGGASWKTVAGVSPFIIIPIVALPFLSKALNTLALGDAQAGYMGINTSVVKKTIILLATMAVGASVAIAGIIGFIGLVIPHILRMAFGPDHRLIVPGSALLGAAVLTLADLGSRTIVVPAELPIGVITAIIGAPILIYIILTERIKNYQ